MDGAYHMKELPEASTFTSPDTMPDVEVTGVAHWAWPAGFTFNT